LANKLIRENNSQKKFFPELMEGTGPFPARSIRKANLELFGSFEEAYHQLVLDLVYMQAECVELARGKSKTKKLFMAGRLCQSDVFVKMLATRLSEMEVFVPIRSSVTPLGAAIAMHGSWNNENDLQDILKFRRCDGDTSVNIREYSLF
jgi:glycerol kinase